MNMIKSAEYPDNLYKNNLEYLADELKYLNMLIAFFLGEKTNIPDETQKIIGSIISEINASWNIIEENNDAEKPHAALTKMRSEIDKRREASLNKGVFLPLPYLANIFFLSRLEEMIILISTVPELDHRYAKIYELLHQRDIHYPSIDLILGIFSFAHNDRHVVRQVFDDNSALFRNKLLYKTNKDTQTFYSSTIIPDKRIVAYMSGSADIDSRLTPFAEISSCISCSCHANEKGLLENILNLIKSTFNNKQTKTNGLIFHFHGDNDSEKDALITAICANLGVSLLKADMSEMIKHESSFVDNLVLLARESLMQNAIISINNMDAIIQDNSKYPEFSGNGLKILQEFCDIIFITGTQKWVPEKIPRHLFISQQIDIGDHSARAQLWEHYLDNSRFKLAENVNIETLATKFRLSAKQIENALNHASNSILLDNKNDGIIDKTIIYSACREQIQTKLGELAQKITPKYDWDDIVLPPAQKSTLREICNQALYRNIVYRAWGFGEKLSLGKGLNILFSGPSGTGKTMAAEVIAKELNQEIYKIDLSRIVSKYIGETEKNLAKIFKEAEYLDAILFFDEGDSLLGKRSEVKDAHDRYANIEVGYLLQKFEEHEGITITASNLKKNIDEAFQRRMHFSVEFSPPDEETRRMIWRSAFPKNAPLADNINFDLLATKFNLNGGNIKNAALNAAFLAAADSSLIGMEHLILAIRREYQKTGNFLPRDIENISKNN